MQARSEIAGRFQVELCVRDIAAASALSHVLSRRFKGGWTTRHYGQPAAGVHAIQLEIAQSAYLREETLPFTYDEAKVERLRATLRAMLTELASVAPSLSRST